MGKTYTWKHLIDTLRYHDWVNESRGVWRQVIPNSEISVIKNGDKVVISNFGSGGEISLKYGYLDGVIVEPRHVLQIINMINEVKSNV